MRVALILFGMLWVLVLGAYFWPSSMGQGCPQLTLTADQTRSGAHTRAELQAAEHAASERQACLLRHMNGFLEQRLPSELALLETTIRAIYGTDDLRIFTEQYGAAGAAERAARDVLAGQNQQ